MNEEKQQYSKYAVMSYMQDKTNIDQDAVDKLQSKSKFEKEAQASRV